MIMLIIKIIKNNLIINLKHCHSIFELILKDIKTTLLKIRKNL